MIRFVHNSAMGLTVGYELEEDSGNVHTACSFARKPGPSFRSRVIDNFSRKSGRSTTTSRIDGIINNTGAVIPYTTTVQPTSLPLDIRDADKAVREAIYDTIEVFIKAWPHEFVESGKLSPISSIRVPRTAQPDNNHVASCIHMSIANVGVLETA
jgi:hypothetical protein